MAILANFKRRMRDFFGRDLHLPIVSDTSQGILVPAELKPFLDIDRAEEKRQREVLWSRALHDGRVGVLLTERLQEFLGADPKDVPGFNISRLVTMAIVERMILEGLESDATDEAEKKRQNDWIKEKLKSTVFDENQAELWEMLIRDGECFLFVDWDPTAADGLGDFEIIPHPRYTDPDISYEGESGDGFGIRMIYPGNNIARKPVCAVKRSTEVVGTNETDYLTVYYPDRVEMWQREKSGWMKTYTPTEEHPEGIWPVPWTAQDGKPLGLPVVHLRTPYCRPDAIEALRNQRALDKLLLDFLTSSDMNAFRIWKFFGWDPVDDDGNPLPVAAGQWVGSADAKPEDAVMEAIDAPDMSGHLTAIEKMAGFVAMATDTPIERVQMTGAVARKETIEQQDQPAKLKCERRQVAVGAGIVRVFEIGRRLENHFRGNVSKLSEKSGFVPTWKDLQAKTIEDKQAETEAMKSAGFSDEEIQEDVWGKKSSAPNNPNSSGNDNKKDDDKEPSTRPENQ